MHMSPSVPQSNRSALVFVRRTNRPLGEEKESGSEGGGVTLGTRSSLGIVDMFSWLPHEYFRSSFWFFLHKKTVETLGSKASQLPDHLTTHPPIPHTCFGHKWVTGAVRSAPRQCCLPCSSFGWELLRMGRALDHSANHRCSVDSLRAKVCSYQRLQPLGRSTQRCLNITRTASQV